MNESSEKCPKCGQGWEQHEFGVPAPYCHVETTERMTTQPDIDAIAKEAAQKHAEAIEVLKDVEWIRLQCPVCKATIGHPHKPDCKLAKVLGK